VWQKDCSAIVRVILGVVDKLEASLYESPT
jgi:hypothetical protein